jgi:hypothetical protein
MTTSADYNLAVRIASTRIQLIHDAPSLLPLYCVLSEHADFPSTGEPLTRIRQHLDAIEISGYVWRLLLKSGSRLMPIMREFYSETNIESVRDYLQILDSLRVAPGDLPVALRLLFSEFGNCHSRRARYWPQLQASQGAFSHLLRVARMYDRNHRPTEENMALVIRWVISRSIHGWDRAQRQRGWPWLLASAQAWQDLELSKQQVNQVSWSVPFSTLVWGGLTFRALANASDMIVHGHEMRNCTATCTPRSKSYSALFVAVSKFSGKCVATGSYRFIDGAWRLCGAKGPANRELSQALLRPMYHFAQHIPFSEDFVAVPLIWE